jgi:hypothetical protein
MMPATISLVAGLLSAASLVFGCDLNDDAGRTTSESRSLAAFDRIDVRGGRTDMAVRFGREQTVELSGGEQLLAAVTTTVSNGTLTIDRGGKEDAELDVTITVPRLRSVEADTGGEIELVDVDADVLELRHDGAGTLTASGRVEALDASLGGVGELSLEDLTSERASVRLDGLGDAEVTVTDELDATVTGLGSIEYNGNPSVDRHISGLGDVTRAGA